MVRYPIHVPMHPYSGRGSKRRREAGEFNELAKRLEDHVNEKVRRAPLDTLSIEYVDIARELRLSVESIAEVLRTVDGGENGLTVTRIVG